MDIILGTRFLSVLLLVTMVHPESRYLSGKHVRVAYYDNPYDTYVEVNAQNETVLRGSFINMLQWMARRQNFTYEFVLLDPIEFNNLPEEFSTKKINLSLGNFALRHGRNYLAHHLFPFSTNTFSVVIPYPKPEVNMYSVILPYTTAVWMCFLGSMALISFLLQRFARAKMHIHQRQEPDPFSSYEGATLYVVGVATNQGAACFSKARTVRLLAGIWCLAALVMVNAYSSSLITYMTAPRFKPLVNSIRDIDNKSEPQILSGGAGYFRTLVEINPRYRWLRSNAFNKPADYCGSDFGEEERTKYCMDLVKEGGHVFVQDTWTAKVHLDNDFDTTGTCSLTFASETISLPNGGWAIPLDSSREMRNSFNILVMETLAYGLLSRWDAIYYKSRGYCTNYKTVDQSLRKLSLKDFTSAFLILGGGIAISLIVFVYEVMRGRLLPKAGKKAGKPVSKGIKPVTTK